MLYGKSGLQAFEVKNARRIGPGDLRPLRAFCADYPEADAALLYRGAARERVGGVWLLPVDDFLRRLRPDTPPLPVA